jgi:hypothetical protein
MVVLLMVQELVLASQLSVTTAVLVRVIPQRMLQHM